MPDARATRVLIAGVSARAMAESAARGGYEVTSLDAFGDLDRSPGVTALSLTRDFGAPFSSRALVRASRSIACDVVAYLSPLENYPSAVMELGEGRVLWGNDASVLRRARDPSVIDALFERARREAVQRETRWLLKPRASGGGHGIGWWRPGEPVARGAYVQRFVDGIAGSIAFVAAHGKASPLCLTRQLIGDPGLGASGFRYCGNVLAPAGDVQFDRDDELFAAAHGLAELAARDLGLVGVNGIDFIAKDGVPVAIEINPRWSASMELVERAYGISVFRAHAAACVSGALPELDLVQHRRTGTRAFGKAIIFARHDITCEDTESWLSNEDIRDVPHPGEHIARGRPVCTIFADAADSAGCEAALKRRAAALYATLDAWAAVPT
jgi:predicted ATP-grasp superfamily ATP-dependent carboligase